jgi:hypothetical protein
LFELLTVLCAIFILSGVFAIYANMVLVAGRRTALQNELGALRMSIEHYRVIYGEFPAGLDTLINKYFTMKNKDGIILHNKFLGNVRLDKQDRLLDPFLSRYHYNASDGRVWSGTKGYENW